MPSKLGGDDLLVSFIEDIRQSGVGSCRLGGTSLDVGDR